MRGLPAPLLKDLRTTLLECGPFGSDRELRAVFVDERIRPWIHDIPDAYGRRQRVDLFVEEFLDRKNASQQSVLVLFLQALHDQAIEADACQARLNDVAVRVAAVTGGTLPPLARANLWRASTVRGGEPLPDGAPGYALPAPEPDREAMRDVLPPGLPAEAFAERLESLKQKEKADWLPVAFLELGLRAAHAVGRVEHHGRTFGTAFLVAPDLVLTNAHVIKALPELAQGGVRFHVGLQAAPAWRYFAGEVAHSAVEELDFSLRRLASPVTDVQPVTLSNEAAYPDQAANILQYPDVPGGLMQVALRYNEVVHVAAARIYYVTDTDSGSSGSPVFNDAWSVIALHRAGMLDDARRPVTGANQGVPLAAIQPMIRPYL